MGWRGSIAVLMALAASAPLFAPASADSACAAAATPTRALQSDAGDPGDAADTAAGARALRFPPVAAGGQAAYYWAWLDPPVDRDGDDRHDWFAFTLSPGAKNVMVNVTSNYTASSGMYSGVRLELWRGSADGDPLHVTTSSGPTIEFTDSSGGTFTMHVTRVYTSPGPRACADDGPLAPGVTSFPAQRNYGAYVGCRPFCVTT